MRGIWSLLLYWVIRMSKEREWISDVYMYSALAGWENRKIWKQLSEAKFQQNTLRWTKQHKDPFWYCCSLVASDNWFLFTHTVRFQRGTWHYSFNKMRSGCLIACAIFISVHIWRQSVGLCYCTGMLCVCLKEWKVWKNGLKCNQCFLCILCQQLKITS